MVAFFTITHLNCSIVHDIEHFISEGNKLMVYIYVIYISNGMIGFGILVNLMLICVELSMNYQKVNYLFSPIKTQNYMKELELIRFD